MNTSEKQITEETILLLREGNFVAFDSIYHAYFYHLMSIALYYVHNRSVAMDIVNDVFVSLWQKRSEAKMPLGPYLRAIVKNESISYLRSKLYKNSLLDEQSESVWTYLENSLPTSEDPFMTLSAEETRAAIEAVIEKLPPKCRAIFEACVREGRPYQDVAEEMNITLSTVRVQVKKAMDTLCKNLNLPALLILCLMR